MSMLLAFPVWESVIQSHQLLSHFRRIPVQLMIKPFPGTEQLLLRAITYIFCNLSEKKFFFPYKPMQDFDRSLGEILISWQDIQILRPKSHWESWRFLSKYLAKTGLSLVTGSWRLSSLTLTKIVVYFTHRMTRKAQVWLADSYPW